MRTYEDVRCKLGLTRKSKGREWPWRWGITRLQLFFSLMFAIHLLIQMCTHLVPTRHLLLCDKRHTCGCKCRSESKHIPCLLLPIVWGLQEKMQPWSRGVANVWVSLVCKKERWAKSSETLISNLKEKWKQTGYTGKNQGVGGKAPTAHSGGGLSIPLCPLQPTHQVFRQ